MNTHSACPQCGADITPAIRAQAAANGAKGGKTTGKSKARSSKQARKAALARWEKKNDKDLARRALDSE
jgi:hypothetical protein